MSAAELAAVLFTSALAGAHHIQDFTRDRDFSPKPWRWIVRQPWILGYCVAHSAAAMLFYLLLFEMVFSQFAERSIVSRVHARSPEVIAPFISLGMFMVLLRFRLWELNCKDRPFHVGPRQLSETARLKFFKVRALRAKQDHERSCLKWANRHLKGELRLNADERVLVANRAADLLQDILATRRVPIEVMESFQGAIGRLKGELRPDTRDSRKDFYLETVLSYIVTFLGSRVDFLDVVRDAIDGLVSEGKIRPVAATAPETDAGSGDGASQPQFDAFMSYASEDADFVARLTNALEASGAKIWIDETQVAVGHGVRSAIDRGLASSRYVIVVVSDRYLEKYWANREIDGAMALDTVARQSILPVLHGITIDQLRAKAPTLAGVKATTTSNGLDQVVRDLLRVLTRR